MANSPPTILIFSAGFGDGHNSAARAIVAAITEITHGQVQALKVDLFPEAIPRLDAFLKWGYGFVTTHLPRLWELLYRMAEKDGGRGNLGWRWFGDLHRHMSVYLAKYEPMGVLSTFPMYPYLLAEKQWGLPTPNFFGTVVTDSISINSIWTKAPTDRFFVTDEFSAEVLTSMRGKPSEMVEASGFAVAPHFAQLQPRSLNALEQDGFRILYFATASLTQVKETLDGLIRDAPAGAHLTVVMGRHEARLGEVVREMLARNPQRSSESFGWTSTVPKLLVTHDVVISKGGGATVHECIAAAVPVLVNYYIPGQEEGNVELLKRRACGWYARETGSLGRTLATLWQSGAWRTAKENMLRLRNPNGALNIARRTLELSHLSHLSHLGDHRGFDAIESL